MSVRDLQLTQVMPRAKTDTTVRPVTFIDKTLLCQHDTEEQASSELYGLLKRPDEKFITERAYDNPKFVEDMVRDVAAVLNADNRIEAYVVESENFESIHNHSAYALIERDKSASVEQTKKALNLR